MAQRNSSQVAKVCGSVKTNETHQMKSCRKAVSRLQGKKHNKMEKSGNKRNT